MKMQQSLIYRNVEEALTQLNAKDRGRYFICTCPECQHQEAFMYKNNVNVIQCNRENECGERMILRYEEKEHGTPTTLFTEQEQRLLTHEQMIQLKRFTEIFTVLYLPAMTSDTLENGYRGLSRKTTEGFVADFVHPLVVSRMFEQANGLFPKDYSTNKWMCERNMIFPILGDNGLVDRILLRSTLNPTIEPKEIQLIVNPSSDARDFFVDVPKESKVICIGEALLDTLSFREIDSTIGIMALTGAARTNKLSNYLRKEQESLKNKTFVIAMDNDNAGQKAAEKVAKVLQEIGASYIHFTFPNHIKDGNEFLCKDRTGFEKTYAQFLLSAEKTNVRKNTYERS